MGYDMKYSAGMVSKSFWYLESKKTAKLMLDGLDQKEIVDLAIKDNLFQVMSDYRTKRMANAIYTRLNSLPNPILEAIVNSDIVTSKILVLISIMKTDRLFFEFMHEVFRYKIIIGDYSLQERDINIFFDEKKAQSEIVDNWVEQTIKRLISAYILLISEAGVLRIKNSKKEIITPLLDYRVKKLLLDNEMAPYVYAVTGEK